MSDKKKENEQVNEIENLLLLPNQLFSIPDYIKKLDGIKNVILYEHPQYFKKYNFNKKKLVLHRSSMKYYEEQLKKDYNVTYIEFSNKLSIPKPFLMYESADKLNITPKPKEVLDNPNFLLTLEDYKEYRKKTDKFVFNNFYMFAKKINDIIPNIKSQDKENRKRMPKNITVPALPSNKSPTTNKFVEEAQSYVKKHFSKNYGSEENFQYPITTEQAKNWLTHFIEKKFSKFGDYQDFIVEGEDYLFHSILSGAINIGILNPIDIFDTIKPLKSKIPMNSYEGYIRQLYWREYQRFCYIYCDFSSNYFGNKKKLTKKWYNGTLNIKPVDEAIKRGFETAYLHHIQRLMVVGNWMNLSGISPLEGFRWFMEFSIDSYEWVMYQNVLDMVFFVTGGKTMRKPYVSSSTYVLNMSNYKKGEWTEVWNKAYYNFNKKHRTLLKKYSYHFPTLRTINKNPKDTYEMYLERKKKK